MPKNRSFAGLNKLWTQGKVHFRRRPRMVVVVTLGFLGVIVLATYIDRTWYDWHEKRVAVVVPGYFTGGAWQRPAPLRELIDRERIKTVITLAVIDDKIERYDEQAGVLKEKGVRWIFVPMVDSTATLEQMAEAAELLADPALQPIFFHCVAGHHRTSLAHAAYRIRHEGWTAEQAWNELAQYRWTRRESDHRDRQVIEQFAACRSRSAHAMRPSHGRVWAKSSVGESIPRVSPPKAASGLSCSFLCLLQGCQRCPTLLNIRSMPSKRSRSRSISSARTRSALQFAAIGSTRSTSKVCARVSSLRGFWSPWLLLHGRQESTKSCRAIVAGCAHNGLVSRWYLARSGSSQP